MKIAIIQASSQKEKNPLLESCARESVDLDCHEIINFGIFPEESMEFSYVQTAFCISLLLESRAVDFVITGCSSGQGMMLACNFLGTLRNRIPEGGRRKKAGGYQTVEGTEPHG